MVTKKNIISSFFQCYRWPLVIMLGIGVIGALYFLQRKSNFTLSDHFTKYDTNGDTAAVMGVDQDSLNDIPPIGTLDSVRVESGPAKVADSLFGFALPVYDPLPPIISETDGSASGDSLVTGISPLANSADPAVSAFAPPTSSAPAAPPKSGSGEDIFDRLLPKSFRSAEAEQAFRSAYTAKTISTRGTYKLAAIAGKALLVNATPEVLEMLNALAGEKTIASITVGDGGGRIIYASNARERGRLVTAVYPDLPVSSEAINWMRQDGHTITGIPVFSIGGRVGTVFVTMH